MGRKKSLTKKMCEVKDCNNFMRAKGYCHIHYKAFTMYGDPLIFKRNKNGEGGITVYGYRRILKNGIRNFEHRMVMEEHLGRKLYPHENIHHKNGDRLDNRLDNLELWSNSQPSGQRVEDKIAWAKKILEEYKDYENKIN